MKKYEIILQNKKIKIYSTISWLIIAYNFIAFIYMIISGVVKNKIYPLTGAVLLLVIFILPIVFKKTRNKNQFILNFCIITATWLLMGFYWPAIIVALLFAFYHISTRRLTVAVSENNITYPSFPKKIFAWNDLNNIILKDGLLTIDFKNNKLAQAEVLNDDNDYVVNEREFNDFCRSNLKLMA